MSKQRKNVTSPQIEPLLVNAGQAAATCGVSERKWWEMLSAGQAPPSLKLGGRRLWRVDVLRKWVSMNCPTLDRFEAARGGSK